MCVRAEEIQMRGRTGMKKIMRTERGRTLIIRGASLEQRRKVAEAYIWILRNFMPELGEIKRGEEQVE